MYMSFDFITEFKLTHENQVIISFASSLLSSCLDYVELLLIIIRAHLLMYMLYFYTTNIKFEFKFKFCYFPRVHNLCNFYLLHTSNHWFFHSQYNYIISLTVSCTFTCIALTCSVRSFFSFIILSHYPSIIYFTHYKHIFFIIFILQKIMTNRYNFIEKSTPNMTFKVRVILLWKPPSSNNPKEKESLEMVFSDEKVVKFLKTTKFFTCPLYIYNFYSFFIFKWW